ncbi:MAG: asparagine synthase (glutamine-hydrolyzing) [bacterium]
MCGIAGIISSHLPSSTMKDLLDGMLDAIRHRGPDDSGYYIAPGVAIGMRRLSIIDLESGHQPMLSSDGQTILVYNGEIYNFPELRRELSARGHMFRTRSDTEVILHGYREWKEMVVEHLNGMFAFAIYDRMENRIFIARDHFGIKPLYYCSNEKLFAFCSEPLPILGLPGVSRTLDLQCLHTFLAYKYVPAPHTFIKEVSKLEPGTWMSIDTHGEITSSKTFWRLRIKPMEINAPEAEERLRGLIVASVRRQMISDVPVGVFLSGGIDSGLLLWASQRASNGKSVDAYTVGFNDASFNESIRAARTAKHLGVYHHIEKSPPMDASVIDSQVELFGEPFANLSIPANFLLSRVTARYVKVALNGSGADELFGGYDRYFAIRPPAILAAIRNHSRIFLPIAQSLPAGGKKLSLVSRARRFLETANESPATSHATAVGLFSPKEIGILIPGLEYPKDDVLINVFNAAPGFDSLQRAIWTDISTMMADDYLVLVDRTSMASSLEVRVPFLDIDLAEFAFSLPSAFKIKGWEKKVILRRLARECLPKEIARGPKHGFESPVGQWFRGTLGDSLRDVVTQGTLSNLFNVKFIEQLLTEHRALRRDASKQLLGIYTLARWMTLFNISI